MSHFDRPEGHRRRIAYVIPALYREGGTERSTFAVAHAALAAGHAVTVFAARVKGLAPGIRWVWTPLCPGPGIVVFLSFWISNHTIRFLRRWILSERFDLVHSTGPDVWAPDVVTFHCDHREMLEDHLRVFAEDASLPARWAHSLLAAAASWCEGRVWRNPRTRLRIVVSSRERDSLSRHYGKATGEVKVIPNGVDVLNFYPRPEEEKQAFRKRWGMDAAKFWILFVGNGWKHKGLATLLQACGRLKDPEVGVFVIGHGPESFYRSLAANAGFSHVLFHPGRLPADALSTCYGAADVLVQPSRVDAFGIPVLEAMASGLPVVVSSAAGASECLTDGMDGLILKDPGSAAELAEHLQRLRHDASLRERLGVAAVRTARHYSWETVSQKTIAFYDELLR